MRLSVTLTCQYDSPFSPFAASNFDEGLKWAATCGLDGVELCIADYNDMSVAKKAETLNKKLAEYGLACPTISTGQAFGRENIALASENEDSRDLAINRLIMHIDAASILGSRVTIGLIRGKAEGLRQKDAASRMVSALGILLVHAQKKGVTLLIEPMNRYETTFINNASEAVQFLALMDNPINLQILWDTFHANIEETDFTHPINKMGKSLGHVHFADSNRFFPGFGHIDFEAIGKALKEIRYNGWLSLECLDKPEHNTIINHTPALIERLKSWG